MSAYVSTQSIDCPMFCAGGVGSLTIRGWGQPVTVQPCTICGCESWEVRFTEAEFYLPKAESVTVSHRDGLVSFAAGAGL